MFKTIHSTMLNLIEYAKSHQISVDEALADLESQVKDYKAFVDLLPVCSSVSFRTHSGSELIQSSPEAIKGLFYVQQDESPNLITITVLPINGTEDKVSKLAGIYRRRFPMTTIEVKELI